MLSPLDTAQEFFWDDLLDFIDERRVIPVVGPELVTVPDGRGGEISLARVLAASLAERLHLAGVDCAGDDALHQVVCHHVERGGRREDVYPRLRSLLKELDPPVPPLLRELARIRHFSLFVSTTFDPLLTQAIDLERFGGAAVTTSLAYAPNHVQDLPPEARHGATPVVFHLLGRVSASPDYVITEEDTLEFFTSMLSDSRRPGVLLDELKSSHLLLLGNTFPDWLTRLFIRMAKCGRLSLQREELEVIAGRRVLEQPNLVFFLRHFSYRTQVFSQGAAADFVRELARRYAERHPSLPVPHGSPGDGGSGVEGRAVPPDEAADQMAPGAVFLSYASQDVAAAQKIHDTLEAAGVETWFDKRQLEGGAHWDAEIRRKVRACSYFLPVVSSNTETRLEGYFRFEWDLAVERSRLIAESVPFILPVAIDPVNSDRAVVPERFRTLHWMSLPGGGATPEFTERMVRLIRDYRKRERGLV